MKYYETDYSTNVLVLYQEELPHEVFEVQMIKRALSIFTISGKYRTENGQLIFEFPVDIREKVVRNACERLGCEIAEKVDVNE